MRNKGTWMIVRLLVVLGLLASCFGCSAPAPTPSAAPASVIDVFCHVQPPKFMEALKALLPKDNSLHRILRGYPKLHDMDARFKDTDVPGYKQVISLAGYHIGQLLTHKKR